MPLRKSTPNTQAVFFKMLRDLPMISTEADYQRCMGVDRATFGLTVGSLEGYAKERGDADWEFMDPLPGNYRSYHYRTSDVVAWFEARLLGKPVTKTEAPTAAE